MTPFIIGNIQFTLSLIAYALIMAWFIHPVLKGKTWTVAVVPLLLVHVFRYGPLTLLMPEQVDMNIALTARETIAYGDFVSGLLALVAVVLVRYKLSGAKIAVWVFSVVGLLDVIWATKTGMQAGMLDHFIGFNLYILNFYVPMLIVTHVMIIKYLLKK